MSSLHTNTLKRESEGGESGRNSVIWLFEEFFFDTLLES